MKSAGIATSSQLPEHSARKPELGFNYEVQKIVRHQLVVTWGWVHLDIGQRRTLRLNRVSSLTRASKYENHLNTYTRVSCVRFDPW